MNKREFIKSTLLTGLAASTSWSLQAGVAKDKKSNIKHWVWINPDEEEGISTLNDRYTKYYRSGIRGIFFEAESEKHFKAAKQNGIEAHRWIWTLNRGEKELLASHPEWYAVSRNGDSCAEKPPYVGYYRWLCPSREKVARYLEGEVKKVLEKDHIDGLHLDYVRYCDVILPVNLWDKYDIVQTRELPEYDFCYCQNCRSKFKNERGIDPLDIEYPSQSLSWRNFRYRQVTNLVNRLSDIASDFKKPITAAVFPTPEVAKRIVRQDWTQWNLSSVCPMIYHGFYKENVQWIGDAVKEGIAGLCGKFPLYAGLFLPDFQSSEELKKGIEFALENGASGVSLFGRVDDQTLSVLRDIG